MAATWLRPAGAVAATGAILARWRQSGFTLGPHRIRIRIRARARARARTRTRLREGAAGRGITKRSAAPSAHPARAVTDRGRGGIEARAAARACGAGPGLMAATTAMSLGNYSSLNRAQLTFEYLHTNS